MLRGVWFDVLFHPKKDNGEAPTGLLFWRLLQFGEPIKDCPRGEHNLFLDLRKLRGFNIIKMHFIKVYSHPVTTALYALKSS